MLSMDILCSKNIWSWIQRWGIHFWVSYTCLTLFVFLDCKAGRKYIWWHPFVCLFVCTLLFELFDLWPWFYGSAFRVQQKYHDAWNTVQSLCVFVSNQGMFAVIVVQWSITFNLSCLGVYTNREELILCSKVAWWILVCSQPFPCRWVSHTE